MKIQVRLRSFSELELIKDNCPTVQRTLKLAKNLSGFRVVDWMSLHGTIVTVEHVKPDFECGLIGCTCNHWYIFSPILKEYSGKFVICEHLAEID